MTAAKERTSSWTEGPGVALPLAAAVPVAENSHQGFSSEKINTHPGSSEVKFRTVTGIGASLRREGIRSRCQSLNRYAYVRNNPTRLVDPLGLGPCIPAGMNAHGSKIPNCPVLPSGPDFGVGGTGWDEFDLLGIGSGGESSVYQYDVLGEATTSIVISDSGDYLDFSEGNFGLSAVGRIDTGGASGDVLGALTQVLGGVVNFLAPPLPANVRIGIVPFGFGGVGAATETTTLYRAVSQAELADIQATLGYNASPFGGEVKYFYPTAEQAYQFVNYGMAEAVTSVEVPSSLINSSYMGSALGEGPFIAIPNGSLPGLGPINILPPH